MGSNGDLKAKHPVLFIAYSNEKFGIFKTLTSAKEWINSINCKSCYLLNDVDVALRMLGITINEDEQRKEILKIISPKEQTDTMKNNKEFEEFTDFISFLGNFIDDPNLAQDIISKAKKIKSKCENINQNEQNEVTDYKAALIPGSIVQFDSDKLAYGVVLFNGMILGLQSDGTVGGYLKKFTKDKPCKITGIYKPTKEAFKFSQINDMIPLWVENNSAKRITHTKEEIEKMLGLQPGSLHII